MRALAAVVVVAGILVGPGALSAHAAVTWSVTPATPEEGTPMTVTINRDLIDPTAFTVTTGAPGDTATRSDYSPGPYNVVFPSSLDFQETVVINTTEDSLDEPNETVTVGLTGYGSVTRTIIDDDAEPTLAIASATVAEGTGARPTTMTFPVTLSAASGRAVTVTYSTADGTATAGQDYVAKTNAAMTIPAGQTQGAITVDVTADDAVEPNETFTVTLATPTNATLSGSNTATGTITNDDSAPTVRIVGPAPTAEGSTGLTTPFDFVIELSRPVATPVTAGYATKDGSAAAPADYVATEQSVTFAPGETRKVASIPVVADNAIEPDENFSVALSVAAADGIVASVGEATATIVDDDTPVAPAPPTTTPVTGIVGLRPAAEDTTAPRVRLSRITSSRGVMRVTVACPAGETVCRGTLTVFNIPARRSKVKALRGERKLAASLFVIKGGEKARLTLRPSKRAATLIRRAKTVRARGYAVARDAAGNIATVRTTGTVKAAG